MTAHSDACERTHTGTEVGEPHRGRSGYGKRLCTAAAWATLALGMLASSAAQANVILSAGVRIDAGDYGASTDTDLTGTTLIHARAFAESVGVGGASAGPGANPNCSLGSCGSTAKAHADTEFDTALGAFRADAGGGTSWPSGESDVGGGADFQLDDQITPASPLFFDMHLNWAFSAQTTGADSAGAGALMQYNVVIEPVVCIYDDGCSASVFSFEAFGGPASSDSFWSYFCSSGCAGGGGSGTGPAGTIDVSIALPDVGGPFNLSVTGLLNANCGIYLPDGVSSCNASASAYQSAYLGIRGDFESANGYGFQGYSAAVPEPANAVLLAGGGLLLAGLVRRRRLQHEAC